MLEIHVRNFRGIARADIECAPIALCASRNAGGKSSLCQATQAALTGNSLESFDLTKKDAGVIVRRGAKQATANVKGGQGIVSYAWPECSAEGHGDDPPRATIFAAGVTSIVDLQLKQRTAAMIAYMKAEPSKEDLARSMERFTQAAIDRLWTAIEEGGWDRAFADQETARRDAGRDWEKVTGERFGAQKAQDWRPDGWDKNLDAFTVEDLQAKLADARKKLETALGDQAVDSAELARLQGLVAGLQEKNEALQAATGKLAIAREALQAATDAHAALLRPMNDGGMPCPHCGEKIALVTQGPMTSLVKFEGVDPTENKKRREAVAIADGALSNRRDTHAAARTNLDRATAEAEAANAASAVLASSKGSGTAAAVENARDDVARYISEIAMAEKVAEAGKQHRLWQSAQLKVDILHPAGLRGKKLGEAIEAFNLLLEPLCDVAKWGKVNLTPELAVRLGERPYMLLSESEQYRCRTILQMVQARLDGSTMVIIDRADILDGPGKKGLLDLLREAKIPALVAMTAPQAVVPDLSKEGIGSSYWIEDGITKKIEAE